MVGVDIKDHPRFPFQFVQADALAVLRGETAIDPRAFDLIHASPPCQRYSGMTKRWGRSEDHPDLVDPVRDLLIEIGIPWIIENVPSAPLRSPVVLCGSMFDLGSGEYGLRRHRVFESSFPVSSPGPCRHRGLALPVYGNAGGSSRRDGLKFPGVAAWREGMEIDWMSGKELAESIPPAFTEWIGRNFLVGSLLGSEAVGPPGKRGDPRGDVSISPGADRVPSTSPEVHLTIWD